MKKCPTSKAVLVGFIMMAIAGFAGARQDANPFVGSWKGSLSVAGTELEIALHFTLDENRTIQGTFDSITQGGFGVKLGKIEITGKSITFIIDDPNAPGEPTFKGTLDESGKKLAGAFAQSGYEGTFEVEKQ
jgi:hypothetical protein